MSLVRQGKRESFNIRQGDVVRIRAGTTAYLINRDNSRRLILAKLIVPVNAPGEFQVTFVSLITCRNFQLLVLSQSQITL